MATAAPHQIFPRPSSPTKPDLRPNPHPYAIKTTSTGVLSRSNSSPHNSQATKYHYVPSSPSSSPHRSPRRPPQLHGHHQYSESLSSDLPSPLPIPPSFSFPSPTRGEFSEDDTPRRTKRADTLPSSAPALDAVPPIGLEDLPSNPKEWTPAQLASYLATALRVKSGETLSLPVPVTRDIAQFVRDTGITGRSFLRFNDVDLEELGINRLWRTALLTASRNLRQNVLRGRIWGIGSPADNDDPPTPSSAPPNPTPRRKLPLRSKDHAGAYRNGRVQGMVESLERSGSSASEGSAGGLGHTRNRSGSASSQGSVWSADEGKATSPARRTGGLPAAPELGVRSESEPTMAVLLDTGAPDKGTWGARAWEEDVGVWDTVKRVAAEGAEARRRHEMSIPAPEPLGDINGSIANFTAAVNEGDADADDADSEFEVEYAKKGGKKGDVDMGNGSWSIDVGREVKNAGDEGKTAGKRERRVATAIFADGAVGGGDIFGEGGTDEAVISGQEVVQKENDELCVQADMDTTWALLESFKRRLEEVEGKVEQMEERERILTQEKQAVARQEEDRRREDERRVAVEQAREQERLQLKNRLEDEAVQHSRAEENRLSLSLLLKPRTLLIRVLRYIYPPVFHQPPLPISMSNLSPAASPSASREPDASGMFRALHPTTLSALPSYVLLVSLGMCAVVLRVVIRRVLGRRRGWGV